MLELEPVSKYRKEIYSQWTKSRHKNKDEENNLCMFFEGYSLDEIEARVSQRPQQVYEQRQFEDSHLTKFLHQQVILMTLSLNFLGLISIFLSFLQALSTFEPDDMLFLHGLHSVISLALIVLVILKHFKGVELKEKQLIREKKINKYIMCLKASWLEILVLLFHPNLLTQTTVLQIEQPIYGTLTPFELNNFFEILMLSRVYLLYNALIETSVYCTPRANRMCRIYNAKHEADFGIKSLFNAYPLYCLLILTVTLIPILSRMVMLSNQNNQDLQHFGNSVWFISITMGTVGYGDYSPTSYLGRLIAFIAAISGIILSSLLILTLSQALAMNCKQSKSHITLRRLELRKVLEQYAEETIVYTSFMLPNGKMSEELKKRTEKVKQTIRRLKNMIDTENLNQEINCLFDSLYSNLMEIYLQQKHYAEELVLLQELEGKRINEINFTFAGEIQSIIRDR